MIYNNFLNIASNTMVWQYTRFDDYLLNRRVERKMAEKYEINGFGNAYDCTPPNNLATTPENHWKNKSKND